MMMSGKNIIVVLRGCIKYAALCLLCIPALSSCHFRPLEDPDFRTDVRIRINLGEIKNVNSDIYNERLEPQKIEPTVMHVLFYDKASGKVASENYISKIETDGDGRRIISGNLQLAPGEYKMVAYDFSTEEIQIRNYNDWDKIEAYTDKVPTYITRRFTTRSDDETNIRKQPEHLVVASSDYEKIPFHEGVYVIEKDASSIVESWYLQVKVEGMQYVSSAQAVVSGMVGSNLIATNTRVTDPESAVWFDLNKSEDKGEAVVCNVFNSFGHIDNSESQLAITFEIVRTDGYTVHKTIDLSKLFESEDAKNHHWLLVDELIKVSPPPSSSGAFNPEVSDWEEEIVDIEI